MLVTRILMALEPREVILDRTFVEGLVQFYPESWQTGCRISEDHLRRRISTVLDIFLRRRLGIPNITLTEVLKRFYTRPA